TATGQQVVMRTERTTKEGRTPAQFAFAPTVAILEETDARGPRRPPRDAHPGAARRGVRLPDRSGEDPALDGNGGAGRAAARWALSRQCHRGSLRPRLLPRGGAGAPPGLQLRLGRQRGGAAGVQPRRDRPDRTAGWNAAAPDPH